VVSAILVRLGGIVVGIAYREMAVGQCQHRMLTPTNKLQFGATTIKALVDSGCEQSVVLERFCNQIGVAPCGSKWRGGGF